MREARGEGRGCGRAKGVLKFFAENKDKDVVDEESTETNMEGVDENVLVVVKAGDRCPKCGKSNTRNVSAAVVDAVGEAQTIECRRCSCGKIYLTKRLQKQLPPTVRYTEVDGFEPLQKRPSKTSETVAKHKAGKIIVTGKNTGVAKSNDSQAKCPYCGSTGLFADTGMCWECYKDKMDC